MIDRRKAPNVFLNMKIVWLFCWICQVKLSSNDFSFYQTKLFEICQNVVFSSPNFSSIDSILFEENSFRFRSSIRQNAKWMIRSLTLTSLSTSSVSPWASISYFDKNQNRFVLDDNFENFSSKINEITGDLTLSNFDDDRCLFTEISFQAETGLSPGDDFLYDVYRFVRLFPTSLNCSTNIILNSFETVELFCSIDYEFVRTIDDLSSFVPSIPVELRQGEKVFKSKSFEDFQSNQSRKLWQRIVRFTVGPLDERDLSSSLIFCQIYSTKQQQNEKTKINHICQTKIHFRRENSSTTIVVSRTDRWNFSSILIWIFVSLTILFFLLSFIFALATRETNQRRLVQIKPEDLPSEKAIFSNNNKIQSEISSPSVHRHKPGCPKFVPSDDTKDIFVGQMKKM